MEEELPSVIKARRLPNTEKETALFKAYYVNGLLTNLAKFNLPLSVKSISTFLKNGNPIACLIQGAKIAPSEELKRDFNSLAQKYQGSKNTVGGGSQ